MCKEEKLTANPAHGNRTIANLQGLECNDKPLSQKSDDSDCTILSDQSESNALKSIPYGGAQSADDKSFAGVQTLDRIMLAHSEHAITTGHISVDCVAGQLAVTHENMLQADSDGGVKQKGLTASGQAGMAATVAGDGGGGGVEGAPQTTPTGSVRSIGSLVCRICHNSEDPERLVSPCLCKGSLTYVHIHCLERWIGTSRSTVCELCQFQYNTVQTLRYTCLQSLRMWYSRSMSRRALQEDCQMFSLLTLVAFGIIGTLLVGIQYYFLQGQSWVLSRMWTKGWLIFFLFTTLTIYFINIYMILKSQLSPWYRWWQSARDIKLILENRKPFQFRPNRRLQNNQLAQALSDMASDVAQQQQQQQQWQQQRNPSTTALTSQASPTMTANVPQQQQQQPPYQPNQAIPPTFAAISMPFHTGNGNAPESRGTPLSITINSSSDSIELQQHNSGNSNKYMNKFEANDDYDTLSCCGKMPLAMIAYEDGSERAEVGVSASATAATLHCNKLITAATIEIPLENCLYEFDAARRCEVMHN
ncbi:uncharacterized protein LOC105664937 isoform X2 [Ceratitis capitata]|nr:uncharacterized protein LOC105664937 isoform X2 [Ceratitis capitata]